MVTRRLPRFRHHTLTCQRAEAGRKRDFNRMVRFCLNGWNWVMDPLLNQSPTKRNEIAVVGFG